MIVKRWEEWNNAIRLNWKCVTLLVRTFTIECVDNLFLEWYEVYCTRMYEIHPTQFVSLWLPEYQQIMFVWQRNVILLHNWFKLCYILSFQCSWALAANTKCNRMRCENKIVRITYRNFVGFNASHNSFETFIFLSSCQMGIHAAHKIFNGMNLKVLIYIWLWS